MTESITTIEPRRETPNRARAAALALLVMLGLPVAGCGGDDGDSAPANTPTCGDGEVAVNGTIAGQTVAVRHAEQGHSFINKLGDDNGTLDMTSDQGALSLEFDQLVPHGGRTSAFGWFQDSDLGLDVGNCETGGFVSTLWIDDDGDGGRFVLRDLRRAPYCDGEAVTGELAGCFRYRPF